MNKSKKIICIVLAGLIAFSAVAGTIFIFLNKYSKINITLLNFPINSKNHVNFRESVRISENSKEIQKNYDGFLKTDKEYTLKYKKSLPVFFKDINVGETFCVYPDDTASESFFALGFCGKITNINNDENSVSFIIPELTDVFSEIYINTSMENTANVISTAFYPNKNVTGIQYLQPSNKTQTLMCTPVNPIALTSSSQKLSVGTNGSIGYKFTEPKTKSLLEDYTLICEKLKLKFDCDIPDDDGFSIGASGDVTLDETAVKMLLDYHYDETTDTVDINDYSIGFITKQKVNLSLSAKQTIGLDDLKVDLSENAKILEIEDVTASENGKIVLGTYLIGWQAALPILQNDTNKVSYLSLGIAVQLALTGSGELSLEYSIEESGFAQIEANANGDKTYLIKSYDYPNPVKESRLPTEEELSSVPTVTSSVTGEEKFDLAFGADIGICILGMIPIKEVNNLVEFEITKTFTDQQQKKDSSELIKNNYLLDDNVDSLILSSNSHLKMHLGAKTNLGGLKYSAAKIGGSFQLFKEIWYQSPPAIGFSHSQCGFGGVFVGEEYPDKKLDKTFKQYMKDTDQDSIVTTAKDSLFGSLTNAAFNNMDFDPIDMAKYLEDDIDNYKFNYYTSGVIYVRDSTDKVVATFITGEDIANAMGVHNGLSKAKIEQTYSAPDLSASVDINIGKLVRSFLNIDWLNDGTFERNTYYSCDSDEKMNLIFCNDTLKMIVIVSK